MGIGVPTFSRLALVSDIPPAAEVVARMAREAETLLGGASNRYRLDHH